MGGGVGGGDGVKKKSKKKNQKKKKKNQKKNNQKRATSFGGQGGDLTVKASERVELIGTSNDTTVPSALISDTTALEKVEILRLSPLICWPKMEELYPQQQVTYWEKMTPMTGVREEM
jgi:hypothetical protein